MLRGESNLVYSAPTSGGKTLVAELVILMRLASLQLKYLESVKNADPVNSMINGVNQLRGLGTVLFVVPFVALAEEKAVYFQHMWQDMHIGVQAYHGDDEGVYIFNQISGTYIPRCYTIIISLISG